MRAVTRQLPVGIFLYISGLLQITGDECAKHRCKRNACRLCCKAYTRVDTYCKGKGMIHLTREELERMSRMSFEDVDQEQIPIFGKDSGSFNPYFRKPVEGGSYIVKISFSNNGRSFTDAVAAMLMG